MPTKKPRVSINLKPTTYALLSRLSAVGGDSMSEIVGGFLDVCVPAMERMVVVLERAKAAPEEARVGLAAAVARAEERLLPALTEALDQQDLFLVDAVESMKATPAAASGRAGRARAVPVAGVRTPGLVTRGSGRVKTPPRVPSKGGKHGPL